jgi:formylglycine-generating enzyme required for sulfatase activity
VNDDQEPDHAVTVSDYALDEYEVTVGRFRRFVQAYPGSRPSAGAGSHPSIAGTEWQSEWGSNLPADQATLIAGVKCNATYQTWTDSPDARENKPINCVSWYEAFAFCIWDGGRLATEAEFEYAAAGGSEDRLYPWGSTDPWTDPSLLIFGCRYNGSLGSLCTGVENIAPVGSAPTGNARWGHADLAGSMDEWIFDWYDDTWYQSAAATGSGIVNLTPRPSGDRGKRGAWFGHGSSETFQSAARGSHFPWDRTEYFGIRCARP